MRYICTLEYNSARKGTKYYLLRNVDVLKNSIAKWKKSNKKRLTVRFHSYECLEKAKTWRQKDQWLPLAGAGKRTDRRVTKRHQRGLELFTVSVAIEVMSLHANIKHLSNCTSKVSKFQL